ncbi:MAG: MFS transporter [Clostridiales bacterium]|nr:MFS transporter [Clostridiales bacterium]
MLKQKNFILYWFGQFVSSLGSSMTSFAITIWAYQKTGSVLTLSISGVLVMLPRMIGGFFASPFIDRLNKKTVILLSDLTAGLCTLTLFFLLLGGNLEIWHIYVLNFITSVLGSFQNPAGAVMTSLLVPKEYLVKAGGLQSFADGTVQILSPVLAAAMLVITGMNGVIAFDFITMLFACGTLLFLVKIPAHILPEKARFDYRRYFCDLREGVYAVFRKPILRLLTLFHVFINFIAGITYFNLISPMILLKTNNNAQAVALVNSGMGIGSIVGGFLIALLPTPKSKVKTMFLCCGLSFVLGDLSFALGSSIWIWVAAGFFSNILIPPYAANENYIWRRSIPLEMHGRAFSIKYAVQAGSIPLGMILGGLFVDNILEPFMANDNTIFNMLLGSEKGSGMALMFLITGITGAIICLCGFFSQKLTRMESDLQ